MSHKQSDVAGFRNCETACGALNLLRLWPAVLHRIYSSVTFGVNKTGGNGVGCCRIRARTDTTRLSI